MQGSCAIADYTTINAREGRALTFTTPVIDARSVAALALSLALLTPTMTNIWADISLAASGLCLLRGRGLALPTLSTKLTLWCWCRLFPLRADARAET
jgi:hypothetical protein